MKKPIVAVHSGNFHADDVFAVAMLQLLLGDDAFDVVRTRDKDLVDTADWVCDVGRVYDPEHQRFDHHQPGAPVRENGIPYTASGLVWKHYGAEICGSADVAARVDEVLIQDLDAVDNGSHSYQPTPMHDTLRPVTIDNLVQMFRAPWGEDGNPDEAFPHAVAFAKGILERHIAHAQSAIEAEKIVQHAIEHHDGKNYVVFDTHMSLSAFPADTPFAVAVMPYEKADGNWKVIALRKHPREFPSRVLFPPEWAGLEGDEFKKVSGIPDAVFCHARRSSAYAATKEGAIALAQHVEPNNG